MAVSTGLGVLGVGMMALYTFFSYPHMFGVRKPEGVGEITQGYIWSHILLGRGNLFGHRWIYLLGCQIHYTQDAYTEYENEGPFSSPHRYLLPMNSLSYLLVLFVQ